MAQVGTDFKVYADLVYFFDDQGNIARIINDGTNHQIIAKLTTGDSIEFAVASDALHYLGKSGDL